MTTRCVSCSPPADSCGVLTLLMLGHDDVCEFPISQAAYKDRLCPMAHYMQMPTATETILSTQNSGKGRMCTNLRHPGRHGNLYLHARSANRIYNLVLSKDTVPSCVDKIPKNNA